MSSTLSDSPQTVTITIEYPGEQGPEQTLLPPLPLQGYNTIDFLLGSLMDQLPLPLPYCSIRIQYSGPPGSAIAEVSSVETQKDLVIDSRLANEGDGMAGSGAHPWHLDQETESILFLTNLGDKDAAIGFQIQANGVHCYLTDLKLSPRETRAIDLRKLRDAQEPDFQKNTIPASASDGSVLWMKADNVTVMGRLMVLQRHTGIASNYDCEFCCCVLQPSSISVSPSSDAMLPGDTGFLIATVQTLDCNGNPRYFNATASSTWSSDNLGVAVLGSLSPSGQQVTAVGGGTARISADYNFANLVAQPGAPMHLRAGRHLHRSDRHRQVRRAGADEPVRVVRECDLDVLLWVPRNGLWNSHRN